MNDAGNELVQERNAVGASTASDDPNRRRLGEGGLNLKPSARMPAPTSLTQRTGDGTVGQFTVEDAVFSCRDVNVFYGSKHALKNASLAPVTVLGITFAYMLGGTVIIENIFSLPGMGSYFYDALINKDLPVIQGVVLLTALIFVALNLFVDLLYAYLNPKVRLQ